MEPQQHILMADMANDPPSFNNSFLDLQQKRIKLFNAVALCIGLEPANESALYQNVLFLSVFITEMVRETRHLCKIIIRLKGLTPSTHLTPDSEKRPD